VRNIIVEEFYDKEHPRFELELFGESEYSLTYNIVKNDTPREKKLYSPIKKNISSKIVKENKITQLVPKDICSICNKQIIDNDFITADKGKTIICKKCLKKLY
jgi:formylmethanofuran dehydrogenase subunit E